MKNTFGNSVSITLFGESHGECIGAVIDGLAPGINVDSDFIASQLTLRRPSGKISTKRVENDKYKIVSGVYGDKTTGAPLCIIIPNENTKSSDYLRTAFVARPGHADYTAHCKYHGFEDLRGGGHFSGRLTAAVVAAGAIAISALAGKGIHIATHIRNCAGIEDRDFDNLANDIVKLNSSQFAVLDDDKAKLMQDAISKIAEEGDSIGGLLETVITGIPAGVGEPWFDTVESVLSHALFGIPAVKGIEFGRAFENSNLKGSQYNDEFAVKGEKIVTLSNNNGGINGGITNGMPVLFSLAIKPTPSIFKEQKTVDLTQMKNTTLQIKGRHDPTIIHRARVVVDSISALVICDLLSQRYGTDWLGGKV